MKLSESIHEFAAQVADASDVEAIRTWGYEAAELENALDLAVESEAQNWYTDVEREYDGNTQMIEVRAKQRKEVWLWKARQAREEGDREASVDPTQEGLK